MAVFLITLVGGVKGLQDNLAGVFGYFDGDHKMLKATDNQVVIPLFFVSVFLRKPCKTQTLHQPNATLPEIYSFLRACFIG